jgi:hypothetical protein
MMAFWSWKEGPIYAKPIELAIGPKKNGWSFAPDGMKIYPI